MNSDLKIDQEFKDLIPPLSDDEYKQLEENLKNGWESERGKIIIWDGIIVDGHNRYEICNKHNIPFETHTKKFKDRDAALLWIIDNQKGRRNIPDYARVKLELKKAEILRPKAEANQLSGLKQFKSKSLGEMQDEGIDVSVFQKSEKREMPEKQQQQPENKPLLDDEEKPAYGDINTAEYAPQHHLKPSFDNFAPDEIVYEGNQDHPLKQSPKKSEPVNITKQVAKATKKSVDTVSKVKYISENADAETEKRLMKGDKELSINKVFRDLKKAEKRKEIIETFKQPELPKEQKKYNIIYADPAWSFEHYSDKGKGKSPENHYRCISISDIKKLPINDLADDNCVLFMWVTFPFLEKGLDVIKAWGFEYKTVGFTWVKRNKKSEGWFWGMGYWTRSNAEVCLIATRGSITRQSASVHQIIDTPIEEHSKKPDVARERIVELCGDLPRIELFARQKNEGWDVWGNEVT